MNTIRKLLAENKAVSDYKINVCKKNSSELFFIKGKLETLRSTHTCDRIVTVYVDHEHFRGDAVFHAYPNATEDMLSEQIAQAVHHAQLIKNAPYTLPDSEEEDAVIPSNFSQLPPMELAGQIAQAVFESGTLKDGALNSVEIFINQYEESVVNSRGLNKVQHRYDAMVEAIPTFNGKEQSVELYEQYNFSSLDMAALHREIREKMTQVQARYEAKIPDVLPACPVVFHKQELSDLFDTLAQDLSYPAVYSHSNLFSKGSKLQTEPSGDLITLGKAGILPGIPESRRFDNDGITLGKTCLIEKGAVIGYYGSNRFGQYLGEKPTGNLPCLYVEPGTLNPDSLAGSEYLEVLSMSGLQTDLFGDYLGGEIRLAYYHKGEACYPVTGISVACSLKKALNEMQLSTVTASGAHYSGPELAMLKSMKIF